MIIIISTIIIIINKSKYIVLFILSPIKKIKIENIKINYYLYEDQVTAYINNKNNLYIPIIEINIPFLTTSYIYIKYIIMLTFYLLIPMLIYILYISIAPILKKKELYITKWTFIETNIFIILNILITHYFIVPIFMRFLFTHYTEYQWYEFDVEFQLIYYLNTYFYILYINLCFFIICIIKKHLVINMHITTVAVLFILIFPFDLIIQLNLIIIFLIIKLQTDLTNNILKQIKKYKHTEYLETT